MCIHSLSLAMQANLPGVFGSKGCLRYTGALLWSFWLFLPRRLFCFCKRLKKKRYRKNPFIAHGLGYPCVSVLCPLRAWGLTVDLLWVALLLAPVRSSKAGTTNKDCCSGLVFGKWPGTHLRKKMMMDQRSLLKTWNEENPWHKAARLHYSHA